MLETQNQRLGGPWIDRDIINDDPIRRAVAGAGIRQGQAAGILVIVWPADGLIGGQTADQIFTNGVARVKAREKLVVGLFDRGPAFDPVGASLGIRQRSLGMNRGFFTAHAGDNLQALIEEVEIRAQVGSHHLLAGKLRSRRAVARDRVGVGSEGGRLRLVVLPHLAVAGRLGGGKAVGHHALRKHRIEKRRE